MRIVALIVLVFGLALAGGAVFFASEKYQAIEAALARAQEEAARPPQAPPIATTPVAVANRPLRSGAVLSAEDVTLVEFPTSSVPPNAFTSLTELFGELGREERRIVLRAIDPSEPVLKSKVTGFGERATISAQLTPGMRAFTLQIDTVTGVAGFLLPNDRVDIFLTRNDKGGISSNLIMQNVKVIGVDQFSGQDSNRARVARTATVEVSPADAQKLALAQQLGRISLSLRQIDETAMQEETEPVRPGDIIKQEEAAPVVRAPPPKQLCVRKGIDRFCGDLPGPPPQQDQAAAEEESESTN